METSFIRTLDLCRYYRRGDYEVRALDKVSLTIDRGEFVAVVGASGSGKSTLLALLAGLDTPTAGQIEIGGRHLAGMSRKELAAYRAGRVGMVFQSFNLVPHRTALQNVELALYFDGTSRKERMSRAKATLEKLNLGNRLDHRPADLSGGEQQRVAIARALVNEPAILLADEPTGNLDTKSGEEIMHLLLNLNKERGTTLIIVTHAPDVAAQTGRSIRIRDGAVETNP